jgi:hypothetical protein
MEINKEPRRSTRAKKAVEKYEAPVHVPYTHINRLADKFAKLKMNNSPVPSPVPSPESMANVQAKEAPIANVNATKIPVAMNAATLLNADVKSPIKKSSSPRKTLKRRRVQSQSRSRGSHKSRNSHKSHNKPVTKRKLPFFKSKNVSKTKISPNPKKRVTRRKVVPTQPVRKSTRIAKAAAKMNKSRSKSRNKSKNIQQAPPQKRQRVNWKNLMTAFNTKAKINNGANNNLKGGSLPSGGYDETSEFGPHIPDTESGDVVLIAKVGDVFTPMSREVYEKEYKGQGFNVQDA